MKGDWPNEPLPEVDEGGTGPVAPAPVSPGHVHPFDTNARPVVSTALESGTILSGPIWKELRTFLAVAKAKSLNSAAAHLGTSHMNVSRQIKRLQDMLGSQLVVVSATGATLTGRGEELARTLLRIDRDLFAVTNDLRAESRLDEGAVRLSITDGFALMFLVPAIRQFASQFPRIQVHVKTPINFMSLRENQTDMMIGFAPEHSQDMTCRRLGQVHLLPVAGQAYIDRRGVPTIETLHGHDFVDCEQYSPRSPIWTGWRDLTAGGRIAHVTDSSLNYGMMVKVGLGIGLLGNYTVIEPSFRPLDLGLHISLPLYVTVLTERLGSKPVQRMFDFLPVVFGSRNPWFGPKMITAAPEDGRALLGPVSFEL